MEGRCEHKKGPPTDPLCILSKTKGLARNQSASIRTRMWVCRYSGTPPQDKQRRFSEPAPPFREKQLRPIPTNSARFFQPQAPHRRGHGGRKRSRRLCPCEWYRSSAWPKSFRKLSSPGVGHPKDFDFVSLCLIILNTIGPRDLNMIAFSFHLRSRRPERVRSV